MKIHSFKNLYKTARKWLDYSTINKKLVALAFLSMLNFSQLAVAAAPTEPIFPNQEDLVELSSLEALSLMEKNYRTIKATVTAYSSTPDQTDDTPFVTASNTLTRDGVVAANFLPFGTKIMIPKLFGEKVFIVEDRMHERFSDRVDIWFPDRASAKNFGLVRIDILVLK